MSARRTVVVVQARMTSARLPGKVALPLAGQPLLVRVLERARRIPGVDAVCVAAPEGAEHDEIAGLVARLPDVALVRGPEHDVLERYRLAAQRTGATTVVRVTGDCPLLDPGVAGAVVAAQRATGAALVATALERGFPVGLDAEAVAFRALEEAAEKARDPYEREHVTAYLWRRPERFPALFLDRVPDLRSLRLTVDTRDDYELVAAVYDALQPQHPEFGLDDVLALLARRPELARRNRHVRQRPYDWGPHPPEPTESP